MAIDNHGLKMRGLILASLHTQYIPDNSPQYVQILYDKHSCKVWSVRRSNGGCKTAPAYPVIFVAATRRHMSPQAIADTIRDAVRIHNQI